MHINVTLISTGIILQWTMQEELERSQRLRKAQQEFEIDDDMIGGQQGNSLLELIKQGKLQKKAPAKKEDQAAASSRPVSAGPPTEVRCLVAHGFTQPYRIAQKAPQPLCTSQSLSTCTPPTKRLHAISANS